jgi:DNA polymerase III gamma/tau subunit
MLSSRRIYIIDEAHGLSTSGGQAFLKLLEEPPAHVMFMLCTTDPQKMLKTNRGRCTEFELLPPTRNELLGNLLRVCSAEGWDCPTPILEMVVDCADPDLGVRGTVNMLSKLSSALGSSQPITVDEASVLLGRASAELATSLLEAIFSGSESEAKKIASALRENSSEEAIRVTLLDLTRAKLSKEQDSKKDPRAFRAFEEIVTLPKGRHWLDLYVVRLCREFYVSVTSVADHQEVVLGATLDDAVVDGKASTRNSNSQKFERNSEPVSEIRVYSVSTRDSKGSSNPTTNSTTESSTFTTNDTLDHLNTNSILPSGTDTRDAVIETNDRIPSTGEKTVTANKSTLTAKPVLGGGRQEPSTLRPSSKNRPDSRSPVVSATSIEGLKSGKPVKIVTDDSKITPDASRSTSDPSEPGIKFPGKETVELTPTAGFIAAVSKIDPDLAGALRRCDININDSVVIRYQSSLKADIEGGQKILRQVAGRAGLALQLTAT